MGVVVDFEWDTDIALQPNDEHVYRGSCPLPYVPGTYHFFCAHQIDGRWNTCIDLGEGLTDESRVEDIDVMPIDYLLGDPYEGRGGVVLPADEFPLGEGWVIPIYVPEVVGCSNAFADDGHWKTVYQDEKSDIQWSGWDFLASFVCARPTKTTFSDPYTGEPVSVYSPKGSWISLLAGGIAAADAAMTVVQYRITVQQGPEGRLRAIVELGDPRKRSFQRAYAGKGSWDPTAYSDYILKQGLSRSLEESFHLEPVPFGYHTLLMRSDAEHSKDPYVKYVSMSDDNTIIITPKIYAEDFIRVASVRHHLFWDVVHEFAGDRLVSLGEASVSDEEIKALERVIAPAVVVPEGATILTVFSPVELRVYDSSGRVTGMVDGNVVEEIPGTICMGDTVVVLTPWDTYSYDVVGMQDGTYSIRIVSIRDRASVGFNALRIATSPCQLHRYTMDWEAVSQEGKGVTLRIDSNGDGEFERTVTADSELTADDLQATSGSPVHLWVYLVAAVGGVVGLGLLATLGLWLKRRMAKPIP